MEEWEERTRRAGLEFLRCLTEEDHDATVKHFMKNKIKNPDFTIHVAMFVHHLNQWICNKFKERNCDPEKTDP